MPGTGAVGVYPGECLPLVIEKLLDDATLQDLQVLLSVTLSDVDQRRAPV